MRVGYTYTPACEETLSRKDHMCGPRHTCPTADQFPKLSLTTGAMQRSGRLKMSAEKTLARHEGVGLASDFRTKRNAG